MITPSLSSEPLGDFPLARGATLRRDLADFLDRRGPWRRRGSAGRISSYSEWMPTDHTVHPSGTRQSYQRKVEQPGQVLVWKLAK